MVGANKTTLDNQPKHAGYCWFTTTDGKLYIDWESEKDTTDPNKIFRAVLNAEKADKDSDGNVINTTYAKKTELNAYAPASHASSATTYGVSTSANYGHAKASSTVPKANGTAAVGSETSSFARGDHVHPLQTSVANATNATNATKATQDASGNVITSTYATKTEMNGRAPANHASTATTYGIGDTTNYGHLKVGSNITVSSGTISLTKANVTAALGYTPPTTNTTYTAGTGLSLSGTQFSIANNVFRGYTRDEIGTSPNFDTIDINGLFEVRTSSETPGESGTKPFNSFGPMLSFKYTNTMFQIAGGPNIGLMWRATQSATPTLAGKVWATCIDSQNYTNYLTWTNLSGKPSTFTPAAHTHGAGDITSGTLAVARGGTGLTAAPSLQVNLGSTSAASIFAASPRPGVTGTLAIGNGGTGVTSAKGSTKIPVYLNSSGIAACTDDFAHYTTISTLTDLGAVNVSYLPLTGGTLTGHLKGTTAAFTSITGAVWNDYAEFRKTVRNAKAGQCVAENGDGSLRVTEGRLEGGVSIVSDTYGFSIGETDTARTPIAVAGRVLAYPNEPRNSYKAGDAVCSGPNGTVSKMDRKEIMAYPERIVGIVSEIPDYEYWGTGNVYVDGRIWIKIK